MTGAGDDPEAEAKWKELADAIYRVNPFDVMGKEYRAIAKVAEVFRDSQAPEFMLQSLMDDLRDVARRKARGPKVPKGDRSLGIGSSSQTKDKEIWRNIYNFLKKPMTP